MAFFPGTLLSCANRETGGCCCFSYELELYTFSGLCGRNGHKRERAYSWSTSLGTSSFSCHIPKTCRHWRLCVGKYLLECGKERVDGNGQKTIESERELSKAGEYWKLATVDRGRMMRRWKIREQGQHGWKDRAECVGVRVHEKWQIEGRELVEVWLRSGIRKVIEFSQHALFKSNFLFVCLFVCLFALQARPTARRSRRKSSSPQFERPIGEPRRRCSQSAVSWRLESCHQVRALCCFQRKLEIFDFCSLRAHLLFVSETPMNEASSRSHCIFTIMFEARAEGSAMVRAFELQLCRLIVWVGCGNRVCMSLLLSLLRHGACCVPIESSCLGRLISDHRFYRSVGPSYILSILLVLSELQKLVLMEQLYARQRQSMSLYTFWSKSLFPWRKGLEDEFKFCFFGRRGCVVMQRCSPCFAWLGIPTSHIEIAWWPPSWETVWEVTAEQLWLLPSIRLTNTLQLHLLCFFNACFYVDVDEHVHG